MCDCIQKLEQAFTEMAPEGQERIRPSKGYKIISAGCKPMKLTLGKKLSRRLFIEFRVNWKCDCKKDRSTESGVMASHCPFCGQQLEQD